MIIQAELKCKQTGCEADPCAVDKVIELPSPRFRQFSRALLADYDFIAENKNAIRHDDDARHCLLILDAEGTDGFLIDPQGYNYARYSAFVPNARSLLTPDMGIDRSYDHAEERGGHAVSFVQRFYGLSYPDAVTMLLGGELGTAYPSAEERTEEPAKPFPLPPANKEMRRVFAYLIKHRGIARDVVAHFAKAGLLYEDAEYHNAVFVGTDAEGVPRHAHKRSANSYGKAFRLNVEGSDPRYSFHYVGTGRSLYVFEAPIDMLSFITLYPENWQRHSYVACCGTSIQPVLQMLEQVPQLDTILLCLDNDEAGHQASRRMREQLEMRYSVERLIPENKDWNDDLTLSGENAQGFSMNEMR